MKAWVVLRECCGHEDFYGAYSTKRNAEDAIVRFEEDRPLGLFVKQVAIDDAEDE